LLCRQHSWRRASKSKFAIISLAVVPLFTQDFVSISAFYLFILPLFFGRRRMVDGGMGMVFTVCVFGLFCLVRFVYFYKNVRCVRPFVLL